MCVCVHMCTRVRVQRNPGGAGPVPRSRSPDWLLVKLSSLSADGAGADALNSLEVSLSNVLEEGKQALGLSLPELRGWAFL